MLFFSQGHVNYLIPVAKAFLASYGDKHEVHFAVDQGEFVKYLTIEPPSTFLIVRFFFSSSEYSDKIHKQIPHPALKTHVYESAKEKEDDVNKHWLVEMVGRFRELFLDPNISMNL